MIQYIPMIFNLTKFINIKTLGYIGMVGLIIYIGWIKAFTIPSLENKLHEYEKNEIINKNNITNLTNSLNKQNEIIKSLEIDYNKLQLAKSKDEEIIKNLNSSITLIESNYSNLKYELNNLKLDKNMLENYFTNLLMENNDLKIQLNNLLYTNKTEIQLSKYLTNSIYDYIIIYNINRESNNKFLRKK